MERDAETAVWKAEDVEKFMNSPLVEWIKTFKKSKEGLDFDELSDSVLLIDILLTIDGDEGFDAGLMAAINRSASLNRIDRLRNWMLLVRCLHRCYYECLQQLIVSLWPDIFILTDETDKDGCMMELQKFIVLILGYAVQCERKENYVEEIKSLSVDAQRSLVSHIQQITDCPKNVFHLGDNCLQPGEETYPQILIDLCRDRLQQMERQIDLASDGNFNVAVTTDRQDKTKTRLMTLRSVSLNPQMNSDDEKRKQIRSLNEDLEEKTKMLTEMRDQLTAVHRELSKAKTENAILSAEAMAAKIYKDELDAVKELTLQAEKQRREIERYKNVIMDVSFYRTKLEEFRKENDQLIESRASLEEQLNTSTKQMEKMKNDLVLAQMQLRNHDSEKSELNKKLVEVMEEKAKLEYENSQTRNGFLNRFTSITSIDCLPPTDAVATIRQHRDANSISDEMNEDAKTQLARALFENDELKMKLKEANDKYQDLEDSLDQVRRQDETEFQKKLEAVQQQFTQQRLSKEFEHKVAEIEKQNKLLKETLSKEFQQKQNDAEEKNISLQQHIEELQKQITFIEENWKRDKEICAKLQAAIDNEKRQMKTRSIRENCQDKTNDDTQSTSDLVEKEIVNSQKQMEGNSSDVQTDIPRKRTSKRLADIDNLTDTSLTSICEENVSHMTDHSTKDRLTGRGQTAAEGLDKQPTDIPTSQEAKCRTPIRGVVAPLVRSYESPASSIKLDSRSNSLKHSTPLKPTLDQMRQQQAFLRNDYHRHSMPVRIPSSSQHQRSSKGPKYWVIAGQKVLPPEGYSNRQTTVGRDPLSPSNRDCASTRSHASSVSADDSSWSQFDGSTVSEATGLNRDKHRSHHEHQGSSRRGPQLQYSSFSEKIVTETVTENGLGDEKHRYKALVDQLMQLKAQCRQLRRDNAELQQQVQPVQKMKEKLNDLEEKNVQLEAENKKLRAIIESLQGTVPQSLYDRRMYQFNTIV